MIAMAQLELYLWYTTYDQNGISSKLFEHDRKVYTTHHNLCGLVTYPSIFLYSYFSLVTNKF